MTKIKSTLELMKEKEEMIIKYDKLIYESSQESMKKHREERDQRRVEKQELEDKGWANHEFWVEEFIEPESEPIPEPGPVIEEVPIIAEVDPKEAEIAKLKEQLSALEALEAMKELNKELDSELVEDIIKEGE